MKLFLRAYIPLVLLFCVTFIIYDWTYTRFSTDNDLFDQQEDAAMEIMDVIARVVDKKQVSEGASPSQLLSSELIAAFTEIELQWQAQYNLSAFSVLTPKASGLSSGDMQLMTEQGYIIFEDPDNEQWGVNIASPNTNWVIEVIYDNPNGIGGYYFWLIGYWLLYFVALAAVLFWVLKEVLAKPNQQLGNIRDLVDHIKSRFDKNDASIDTRIEYTHVFQQLNEIDNFIVQEKATHHQHYDDLRDLLHGVAHEFRSPMARASFALDMAENEMESESIDIVSVQTLHKEMESALSELDDLVKEVLSYSRLEHGQGDLDYELISIRSVVQSVLEKQKLLNTQTDFKMVCDSVELANLSVNTDRRLFYRALINLVRNAARFAEHSVLVSWRVAGGQFELKVEDDGPGVPPGKRARIFEPFTRLDPSRSRDSGGAGLGLAITKSISTLHGGTIDVSDSIIGGACFVLRWPIHSIK